VITSFSGFLVELMRLIDGDEGSPTDLPQATLQQIIDLGERRIYKEVRSRYNEKSFALGLTGGVVTPVAVTDNLAPLPDDYQAASVVHFGGAPLNPVPENFILEYNRSAATGDCLHYAEAGNNLTFAPTVADATLVQGRYFCSLPALDASTLPTNALFLAEYELFVYGCLVEGAPIFNKFAQVPLWEQKYKQALDRVNRRRMMAAYSSGRMMLRPSTRLMR
jgi:hypothetical protein